MKSPPSVYVVDDDQSFRSGLGELLTACGYRVILCETAQQLLNHPLQDEAGCILLDLQMPGLSGFELQQVLADRNCSLPIVFISGHGDIPITVQTIKAGAEDFLTKPISQPRLLEAIERALARVEALRGLQGEKAALTARLQTLTPRERQVFDQLVRGLPHKQISHLLGISERTVKLHRHEVVRKLQVRSLAELAAIAERLGLLSGG
ncbi:response regulator [Bradyrhizobium sp. CB2312]|uniref:response regulator transcription factor n=1 Tax=Bradyrhizobium sp. CB2312 TaxID=3039155 RepID=UPI0024B19732|nr:response regulator [Bradyrhizobium sp. CB2312]WFU75525.1 response regulator [Bradyrhizobium sp. CB2312]